MHSVFRYSTVSFHFVFKEHGAFSLNKGLAIGCNNLIFTVCGELTS